MVNRMSKSNRVSKPTILTALYVWWLNNGKFDLKLRTSKDTPTTQFSACIATLILLSSVTLNLPAKYVDADMIKDTPEISYKTILPYRHPVLDLDSQKHLDIWKLNPKSQYIEKLLTTQMTIWNFLTDDMGLPAIQAAGVYGNMMVESGSRTFNVNPYIYSPGQAYYGLCQWNTRGHHSSINGGSLEDQLNYLSNTIESEMHSSNYQRFLNAETPEQASVIFAQWYERCAEPMGRQNEARRAFDRFGT